MKIDIRSFLRGAGADYDAKVEAELQKRRVIHSQEPIKVRIIN
jgi:hypothetical protein